MEEKDKINVKWAQEDVGTSNSLLNNNNIINNNNKKSNQWGPNSFTLKLHKI